MVYRLPVSSISVLFNSWSTVVYTVFNDFPDMLRVSKVIQYADDTVVYFSHPQATTIIQNLTEELGRVAGGRVF